MEGKLDKDGSTVTGALHVTHPVNVGGVNSALIANGEGNVALYAQGVKTGEWNANRLHWVQNLEVGGNLKASGGATFGNAVSLAAGVISRIYCIFMAEGKTATRHVQVKADIIFIRAIP